MKPTSFITNSVSLASECSRLCSSRHQHSQLSSGARTSAAEKYPQQLVSALAKGVEQTALTRLRSACQADSSFPADADVAADPAPAESRAVESDSEEEQETRKPPGLEEGPSKPEELARELQDEVLKVHINLGHPRREHFLRVLKVAKAKPEILRWVARHFECPTCSSSSRPGWRRRATLPRTYRFNKLVAIDLFYLNALGATRPVMNLIDHGSNFQVCVLLKNATSGEVWSAFMRHWVRPFGIPETMMTDGGAEFEGQYSRGLEHLGIYQHVCDAESPHQNGRCERHGGLVKVAMNRAALENAPRDLDEVEDLLCEIVAAKNRYAHRGGFSPYQMVFGENPRLPRSLLSDEAFDEVGLGDIVRGTTDADSPAGAFARKHVLRETAKKAVMALDVRDRLVAASRARRHVDCSFSPGSWVYVWRRGAKLDRSDLGRSRWTGPGVVVFQQGTTIWVAMRSRLLKCSQEQVRWASRDESWGAELLDSPAFDKLRQDLQHPGRRVGAVDVEAEGSPPPEAWDVEAPPEGSDEAQPAEVRPPPPPPEQPGQDVFDPGPGGENGTATPNQVLSDPPTRPVSIASSSTSPPSPVMLPIEADSSRPIRGESPGDRQTEPDLGQPPLQRARHASPDRAVAPTPVEQLGVAVPAGGRVRFMAREFEGTQASARQRQISNDVPLCYRRPSERNSGGQPAGADGAEANARARSRTPDPRSRPVDEAPRPSGTAAAASDAVSGVAERVVPEGLGEDQSGNQGSQQLEFDGELSDRDDEQEEELWGELCSWYGWEPSFWESRDSESFVATGASGEAPPSRRGAEVSLKALSNLERELFVFSDAKEWQAIIDSGAVRVVPAQEAALMRKRFPDRVLGSRMVRRFKPQEGVGAEPIAKSRWCVQGHHDPDSGELHVYSPTPQAESIMLTIQAISSLGWQLEVADAKNAFCQSNKLARPRGQIFCEPCQGLSLAPGELIELIAPVYGLNDAPLLWHRTLTSWLVQDGFEKSLLEPCLWVKRSSQGEPRAIILIEVDDLIVATHPQEKAGLKTRLQSRFNFGKWKTGESDFAGRHLRQAGDRIYVDQEKYILEQLAPMRLAKERRAAPSDLLTQDEIRGYRTMVAQIQWLGRETRPDVAAGASLQSAALPSPTVADAMLCIKIVKHLKSSSSQKIVVWSLDPNSVTFVTVSDAGGPGSARRNGAQGGWMVLAADPAIRQNVRAKVSLLAWRSTRLKRVVASTSAAETLSLSAALAEAQWLSIMWRDLLFKDVQRPDWHLSQAPFSVVLSKDCTLHEGVSTLSVVDAKSIFDTLSKNSAGSRADRRTAIELAVVRDSMTAIGSQVRWVPHGRMAADTLTKADPSRGNVALQDLLGKGTMVLIDEDGHMTERALNQDLKSRSRKASREILAGVGWESAGVERDSFLSMAVPLKVVPLSSLSSPPPSLWNCP